MCDTSLLSRLAYDRNEQRRVGSSRDHGPDPPSGDHSHIAGIAILVRVRDATICKHLLYFSLRHRAEGHLVASVLRVLEAQQGLGLASSGWAQDKGAEEQEGNDNNRHHRQDGYGCRLGRRTTLRRCRQCRGCWYDAR